MARLSTLAIPATQVPMLDTGTYNLPIKVTLPITGIGSAIGDFITLAQVNRSGRNLKAKLEVQGTLGAGAVVQLVLTRLGAQVAVFTLPSVAGAASLTGGITLPNVDVVLGDLIELVVSGAAITAAALIKADIALQH